MSERTNGNNRNNSVDVEREREREKKKAMKKREKERTNEHYNRYTLGSFLIPILVNYSVQWFIVYQSIPILYSILWVGLNNSLFFWNISWKPLLCSLIAILLSNNCLFFYLLIFIFIFILSSKNMNKLYIFSIESNLSKLILMNKTYGKILLSLNFDLIIIFIQNKKLN